MPYFYLDGTTTNKNAYVKVTDNVKAISAGYNHTIILKTDNIVWGSGTNSHGELGDGSNQQRNSFVKMYLQ